MSQLNWGQRLQVQVSRALNKAGQVCKGVQPQAVIPIIRQMGHEDADLRDKRNLSVMGHQEMVASGWKARHRGSWEICQIIFSLLKHKRRTLKC